jgi:hypothetical protein
LREAPFLVRPSQRSRLPGIAQSVSLNSLLVDKYPSLNSDDAIALLRAARSYQGAVWNADDDPNFAWLQLVSAIETVASRWYQKSKGIKLKPSQLLQSVNPTLLAKLIKACNDACVKVIAGELAPVMKAQHKYLSFLERFMPAPPMPRPLEWVALPWTDNDRLREAMKQVYHHRSKALHESIPFPPAMSAPPMSGTDAGDSSSGWSERPGFKFFQQAGGTWLADDLPILLSTFEYIVRSALQAWWQSL